MGISYSFDREWYMHGACQYYALALVELLGGQVGMWLDRDLNKEEGEDIVLCHAYAKLCDGVYIDAYGAFSDIKEREEEFDYNEKQFRVFSIDEAKKMLKSIKVPYTEVEDKRNTREHLRNTMQMFEIEYGNNRYIVGLCGKNKETFNGVVRDTILVRAYDTQNKKFTHMLWQIPRSEFGKCVRAYRGEMENKKWYYR